MVPMEKTSAWSATVRPAARRARRCSDPIFFYPPLGRTFGELSADEKGRISHRAAAAAALLALLAVP
jgi:inosine/xanthosine triphosphate pyrophosphatase family protein